MWKLIKLYLPSLYLIQLAASTGKSLPIRGEIVKYIFLEITPSKNNLLETLSKFHKEYRLSLEFKADSEGSNRDNIIDIGNGHVGIWMDFANNKVLVESKVSGSTHKTKMSGFSYGSWVDVDVSQSRIGNKVTILC